MDAASAQVAMDRLQGAKLGGKPLTVRRARSFYILQQQQATLRANVNQRERERGGVPSQYDLERRTEQIAPLRPRSSGSAPAPLREQGGEVLSAAGAAQVGPARPAPEAASTTRIRGAAGVDTSEDAQEWVFKEEERIRKQAMREVLMESDKHKRVRRRRRVGGELIDLPEAPEEDNEALVGNPNTAKLVKVGAFVWRRQ